jgi:peptidoglycan/xylan/chitin deacetylase (PgdA/CDA1 family)
MMKRLIVIAALLTTMFAAAWAAGEPPRRTMALTFDDLPYVSWEEPSYLQAAERATGELLRVLKLHHAPAVAFVNEAKLQQAGEVDARIALLQRWVDAGMTLANHTYSHPDFNQLTAEQFEDEIVRGDVISRRLMKPREPYQLWFRHPMTHTGDTPAKKEAVEAFLSARGYKVAPHTIENSDFIFNVPYARSRRDGDDEMRKKLRDAYLEFTAQATGFAESVSQKIFGREIPQTLLLHANEINADLLDEMLAAFEARGYRFVTLDEAARDDAYATKDTQVSRSGPTWLWRWMKSKGMSVSFAGDPEPPAWVTAAFGRK